MHHYIPLYTMIYAIAIHIDPVSTAPSRQIDSALLALGLKSPGSASRQTGGMAKSGFRVEQLGKKHGNHREFL